MARKKFIDKFEPGLSQDALLSPTLSSIVPLEEREQAPFALDEEFCLTPF
jgi:hypothetical protein